MDLSFNAEELAFRDEVQAFVRDHLPREVRQKLLDDRPLSKDEIVAWQRLLNARGGWSVPGWPKEWGGPGWTAIQKYIFFDVLHQAPAPEPVSFTAAMIGPVLIAFGSEAQKRRFLPRMANLDDWWAQGFSEPDAGSDLAALRTRAVRDDDGYVVSGQKMWQGMGHWADWMFTLVRTNPDAPKKQAGISLLLIDMKSPGVTVRPIYTIDGRHEVNEVFLDEVRVPIENRVGNENEGWTYAKYLLSNERSNIARVGMTKRLLARTKVLGARMRGPHGSLAEDPKFREKIAIIEIELKALEITQLRVLAAQRADEADPRSSFLKIKGTELRQAASELWLETAGPLAIPFRRESDAIKAEAGTWPVPGPAPSYFNLRAASIYGGANEIQKDIIASSVLGL